MSYLKRGLVERSNSSQQTLDKIIAMAMQTFKPPEKLTVSQWADKNRILSADETDKPGPWETANVPYLRKIMDCFTDEHVREIVFLKCTQIGGTEALLNMVGYVVDQNPNRVIYVLPDDTFCKDFSELRLQKMLDSSPILKNKFNEYESKDTLLKFNGGFIFFASAQSPSKLASWSSRYIFLDEIEKFPKKAKKEASPLKLAEERTKNRFNAKIVKVSTPVYKSGPIWIAWEKADKRYRYFVPCPHCGEYQTFELANIKWPKDEEGNSNITLARQAAYYVCKKCGGRIDDRHKMQMLKHGKWMAENTTVGHAKSVAFHINSIYSPWVRFGDVAAEFLASKNDPVDMQNFVNSWLGMPYEDTASELEANQILARRTEIQEGCVPDFTQLITCGVDVQKNNLYYTVRAWGFGVISQNIQYGSLKNFDELTELMDRYFCDTNGEPRWQIDLCVIDSGYRTEEVYDYCLQMQSLMGNVVIPCKGEFNVKSEGRFRKKVIDNVSVTETKAGLGQTIYLVNVDKYKDVIASQLKRPMYQYGAFMFHADTEIEYAEQMISEHKIVEIKNNREVYTWVPKTSHAKNHYWDCEVYASLAADLMHVRHLDKLDIKEGE
nr:MAG: terminase large subunit [Bacteriophage sp.]